MSFTTVSSYVSKYTKEQLAKMFLESQGNEQEAKNFADELTVKIKETMYEVVDCKKKIKSLEKQLGNAGKPASWIKRNPKMYWCYQYYTCSNCNTNKNEQSLYCPNCGRKMEFYD